MKEWIISDYGCSMLNAFTQKRMIHRYILVFTFYFPFHDFDTVSCTSLGRVPCTHTDLGPTASESSENAHAGYQHTVAQRRRQG